MRKYLHAALLESTSPLAAALYDGNPGDDAHGPICRMAAQQQYTPAMNAQARLLVNRKGIQMRQQIFSTTFTSPGSNTTLTVQPRYVGLIKRFFVECQFTLVNTAAQLLSLTNFNVSNFLSNITLVDLSNLQRINTTGWHVHLIQSVKNKLPYGAAITTDSPVKFGNNFNVIAAPATIGATSGSTGVGYMIYEIPCAYTDDDLRGAIYAGVVNATMQLQLTVNPTPVVASTADPLSAIYSGPTATGTLGQCTVNVYQEYMDQLPQGQGGPVLPLLDMSTIYELKQTSLTGITTAQDFPIPYANFRDFLSTIAIFDNGGVYNTGSDINFWALQSANFTNVFKESARMSALDTRKMIGDDMPGGTYYFDHRRKPISTVQYGNMNLVMNPSGAIGAGSQVVVAWEDFGLINAVTGAGSLPAS